MVDQLPRQRSELLHGRSATGRSDGPGTYSSCHTLGTSSAVGSRTRITSLAGGDFGAGEGVPGYVYPALYVWMMTPLVASIVVGALGWLKGHRPAAMLPALAARR